MYRFIEPIGEWLLAWRGGGRSASKTREVDVPGHGTLLASTSLDLTGQSCLRTNLATKRALDAAPAGAVIEIVSDNLSSVETIPFMLAGHGCNHLGTVHVEGSWRIYVRKSGE